MIKKIILGVLLLSCIFIIFSTKSEAAVSLEQTNVDIYQLNGYTAYKYGLELPSNLPTTYQIKVNGTTEKPKYEVIEGTDIVNVDENGLVQAKVTRVTYQEGNNVIGTFNRYNFGTATIKVTVSNISLEIKINLISYSYYYCKGIAQDYIDENITKDMTEYEKLTQICKFVASYDYSASSSGFESMILSGGGDCWSSSYTILEMCDMLGIKAQLRNGTNDGGAGSGHRNVSVLADGKVYVAEAGYNMKAPRYYSIVEEPTKFFYTTKSDGTIKIIQYDGFDENIVVPSTINGKTVTEIADNAFYWGNAYGDTEVKSITLPSTIKTIGKEAFWGCSNLTNLNIPENVEFIGGSAFYGCENLNNFSFKSNYLTIENNVIYDKDKTILMCIMPNKDPLTLTLPQTVKEINSYAFYKSSIEQINLNEGLEEIGEYAFYYSKLKGITIPSTVTLIKKYSFAMCDNVGSIIIEDNSKTTIEDYAFYHLYNLCVAKIPSSVIEIADNSFYYCNKLTIYGISGSKAESYAKGKEIEFVASSEVPILDGMAYLDQEEFTYNGASQKPNVTIYMGSKKLTKDIDYTVSFSQDTTNAGKPTITIKGKGNYTGEVSLEYEIKKAKREFDFEIEDIIYGQGELNPVITKNPTNATGTFYYGKVDSPISSNAKPTEIGEYVVYITIPSSQNYERLYLEKTVSILPSELPFKDVKTTVWYYDSIKYCFKNGIIMGTTDTTFSPNTNVTRGNLVTILWRMEGSPKVSGNISFPDVKETDYYYEAVKWAEKTGVVHGYDTGKFGPNNNISREQLATILNNYAKYKKKDTNVQADLSKFTDNKKISSYAREGVAWAVAKKVISGKENGTKVDPQGKASRAEAAAMIQNYCNYVGR